MSITLPPIGKMRIYGAGGAGINIAHYFNDAKPEAMSAEIKVTYLDTSRSNLNKAGIRKEDCYVLDADGSGKVRSENYDEIAAEIKKVILEHKPLDFNVVIFSGSGGSGSVFGPLLVRELLSKDIPTIAVVVGSDESFIATDNTIKTLKSLEGASKKLNKPVIMHYRHNPRGKARSEVDAELHSIVSYLAVLCCRQVPEIDTRDVANLLNYTTTTSVEARLCALEVLTNDEPVYDGCRPHSIVSIYETPDAETLKLIPEYHCAGYAQLPDSFQGIYAIHYLVDVESVQRYMKQLQKTYDELKEVKDSRIQHTSLVSANETDDNGMVI